MIVVCNTSPLTNLAAIGRFELLHEIFDKLHIAEGVWAELNFGGTEWAGRAQVAEADWIERHHVKNELLVHSLRRDLDRGEAETIALALELQADVVLLDEMEGRNTAQRMGLRVVGVVGLLLEAKNRGLLSSVRPWLERLQTEAGFYLSKRLFRYALGLAKEELGESE
ncbi:MAG: DUF3368 domain-containing protein [Acidobacteriota bacterium]|nr:DUF3368 domain-containing protein [Acidobacteriota bacterium]